MALVLTPSHLASLKPRFLPDRPGPLIGLHVIHTGHGHAWADRWPDPHAILTETAGNYSLIGDPDALIRDDLRPLISGFVEAPDAFVPLLRAAFPDLIRWPRVIYSLPGAPYFTTPDGYTLRRLGAEDAGASGKFERGGQLDLQNLVWGGKYGGERPRVGRVRGRATGVRCEFVFRRGTV